MMLMIWAFDVCREDPVAVMHVFDDNESDAALDHLVQMAAKTLPIARQNLTLFTGGLGPRGKPQKRLTVIRGRGAESLVQRLAATEEMSCRIKTLEKAADEDRKAADDDRKQAAEDRKQMKAVLKVHEEQLKAQDRKIEKLQKQANLDRLASDLRESNAAREAAQAAKRAMAEKIALLRKEVAELDAKCKELAQQFSKARLSVAQIR